MRNRLGIFYVILVVLLLILGAWWLYFLTQVGQDQAEAKMQKLANDRIHAAFLIEANPEVKQDPEGWLGASFPHLRFTRTVDGINVVIDPQVASQIQDEARATRNMFLYEGFFFIILLVAGSTILFISWRSEHKFTQSRELFLSGVTHEFKTPLASLKLYTETLCREGLKDSDRTRIRERMVEDVRRLETLVDDVLAMSADDTFDRGPRVILDLNDECAAVVEDLEPFARDHGATLAMTREGAAHVEANHLALALALRNLVVNAIVHGIRPVNVEVRVTAGRDWHRIAVEDDGPGIPRSLQVKVFDLFVSGKKASRTTGAGVGLHLVKRNVENLGGRIELESETGVGSTFTMVLPAAEAAPENGGHG
jgi:signal transduction histidine kinase